MATPRGPAGSAGTREASASWSTHVRPSWASDGSGAGGGRGVLRWGQLVGMGWAKAVLLDAALAHWHRDSGAHGGEAQSSRLVLVAGLPGSGKTALVKALGSLAPRVDGATPGYLYCRFSALRPEGAHSRNAQSARSVHGRLVQLLTAAAARSPCVLVIDDCPAPQKATHRTDTTITRDLLSWLSSGQRSSRGVLVVMVGGGEGPWASLPASLVDRASAVACCPSELLPREVAAVLTFHSRGALSARQALNIFSDVPPPITGMCRNMKDWVGAARVAATCAEEESETCCQRALAAVWRGSAQGGDIAVMRGWSAQCWDRYGVTCTTTWEKRVRVAVDRAAALVKEARPLERSALHSERRWARAAYDIAVAWLSAAPREGKLPPPSRRALLSKVVHITRLANSVSVSEQAAGSLSVESSARMLLAEWTRSQDNKPSGVALLRLWRGLPVSAVREVSSQLVG